MKYGFDLKELLTISIVLEVVILYLLIVLTLKV